MTTRTTAGLRDMLFNELDSFLGGKIDKDHVDAVTKLTSTILKTVAKDLEAAKMLRDMNAGSDIPKAIADLNLNLVLTSEKPENGVI